jgi:hypothetical protein
MLLRTTLGNFLTIGNEELPKFIVETLAAGVNKKAFISCFLSHSCNDGCLEIQVRKECAMLFV